MKELEKQFTGKGEVKPFEFLQNRVHTTAYLYEVFENGVISHYEVFKRKITPVCIDFENRIYSETEFKEVYPKSKDFGVWAWTCRTYEKAWYVFESLRNESL